MFKQRLVTGILLIIAVLLFIFYVPVKVFIFVASIAFLYMAWEWGVLLNLQKYWARMLYVILIAFFMFGSQFLNIQLILWGTVAWWLLALVWVILYPKGASLWSYGMFPRLCMGVFTLVPCWLSIITIRAAQDGIAVLLFLLFITWAADTGAYLVGKWRGKHQLMAAVSPKKTWEGFVGGVIFALLIALLGVELMQVSFKLWPIVLLLTLITVIFSVIGDLFESMLKRQVGLKDIGQCLPGHGGFLDRIDSLTAAAPIFLLGSLLIGVIVAKTL